MVTASESVRSSRLLRTMHTVLSHDLPNQVVALQSLLQMLELEEAGRLSEEGQEYVTRLRRVAGKAGAMARFLKEMSRLDGYRVCLEEVSVSALRRQLKVEFQQSVPDATFDCPAGGDIPVISADPRLLAQGLVEVLRSVAERLAVPRYELRLSAFRADGGVELHVELSAAGQLASAHYPERTPIAERLEFMLAREILATFGARLTQLSEAGGQTRFTVLLSGKP
jgi:light-regulated signal transduction histidine kinase (bacteriophytochrome)